MKILSIIAQKPSATGSGVYLSELVRAFDAMGHMQAVVAGVYEGDSVSFPAGVAFYPVFFSSAALDFPIAGMSDTMPYESTIYSEMSAQMLTQMKAEFLRVVHAAVDTFCPDVLFCHHLFFLAAWVREAFPALPVVGLCHGTDLRQLLTHPRFIEPIAPWLRIFDRIFVLQSMQKQQLVEKLGVCEEKIMITGTGYNSQIFHKSNEERWKTPTIIYAGKLSLQKGVVSLLRSMAYLQTGACLQLAGGAGSAEEKKQIEALAEQSAVPVEFLGHLDQAALAQAFQKASVFVLPSFYEGLPLVLMEALACGAHVVCTDLPGVRPWIDQQLPAHGIRFVPAPEMKAPGTPCPSALVPFEKNLAAALDVSLQDSSEVSLDLSQLSWSGLAKRISDALPSIPTAGK